MIIDIQSPVKNTKYKVICLAMFNSSFQGKPLRLCAVSILSVQVHNPLALACGITDVTVSVANKLGFGYDKIFSELFTGSGVIC